jgi:Domain of unknown function (DUF4314)
MTNKFYHKIGEHYLIGKRIRLIYTNDPYTRLKSGDIGTIRFKHWNHDCMVLHVKWNDGSNLGLIEGKDSYEIIGDKGQ